MIGLEAGATLPKHVVVPSVSSLEDVVRDQPPKDGAVSLVEHIASGCDAYTAQENWKAAFNTGRLGAPVGTLNRKIVDKAKVLRLVRQSLAPMFIGLSFP